MAQRYLKLNDKYDYKRTDWKDQAYEKINANFEELYTALGGIGGGEVTSYWGQIGGLLSAQTDLVSALAGKETAGAVLAHEALGDPHAQYLTTLEAQALFEAVGASSSTMAAHLLAADPHPNYLTAAEGSSLYASAAAPTAAVSAGIARANRSAHLLRAAGGRSGGQFSSPARRACQRFCDTSRAFGSVPIDP